MTESTLRWLRVWGEMSSEPQQGPTLSVAETREELRAQAGYPWTSAFGTPWIEAVMRWERAEAAYECAVRQAVLVECVCGHGWAQHFLAEAVIEEGVTLAPEMTHCNPCFNGTDEEHARFTHDFESRAAALARLAEMSQ